MDRADASVRDTEHQLGRAVGVGESARGVLGEIFTVGLDNRLSAVADRDALGGRNAIVGQNDLDDLVCAVFIDGIELESRVGIPTDGTP